jgi:hypothetical protein
VDAQAIVSRAERRIDQRKWTVKAWFALLIVDLSLRFGGFPRVRRMVERTRIAPAAGPDDDAIDVVCEAVERAAVFHVRSLECVQRSAATTRLLRGLGVPAVMVVGCRTMPISGHAWVEVDDRVVNDRQAVKDIYPELMRF